MPYEELVELREKNTNTQNNDVGDFTVSLGQVLTINKGDQIQLKNAFIDTVTKSSGRIMVEENQTNITFNVGLYIQDSNTTHETAATAKTYYQGEADTAAKAATTRPNGKNYILCSKDDLASGGGTEMMEVSAILIKDESDNKRFIPDQWRRMYLQYKDVNSTLIDYWFEIHGSDWAKISPGIGQTKSYTAASGNWKKAPILPLICLKDAFGSNTPFRVNPNKCGSEGTGARYAEKSQWSYAGVPSNTPIFSNTSLFTPWTFPIDIVIPYVPDGYDPTEFARLLTDEMTKTVATTTGSALQSNLILQSTAQLKARGSRNYSGVSDNVAPFWCCEDGSDILQYNTNHNYIVGSSQFAVGYDLETNIFTIDAIHSSIYDGNSKCVQPFSVDNKSFILNKASGIFIDSINMTDILIQQMNFKTSIFTKPYGSLHNTSLTTLTDCRIPLFRLFDGVNITGERKDIDSYIAKGSNPANSQPTYDTVFAFNAPGNTQPSGVLTDDVMKIYGLENSVITNDQAYFQIEIESNYLISKYSNEINSKKIHAIVNKYYSSENYTTGDASSGLMYIHNSEEPLMIKDFRVRILNPDGQLSSTSLIQADNTVFLQIIRN